MSGRYPGGAKRRLTLQVFASWCTRLNNQITLARHDNNHNIAIYTCYKLRNWLYNRIGMEEIKSKQLDLFEKTPDIIKGSMFRSKCIKCYKGYKTFIKMKMLKNEMFPTDKSKSQSSGMEQIRREIYTPCVIALRQMCGVHKPKNTRMDIQT